MELKSLVNISSKIYHSAIVAFVLLLIFDVLRTHEVLVLFRIMCFLRQQHCWTYHSNRSCRVSYCQLMDVGCYTIAKLQCCVAIRCLRTILVSRRLVTTSTYRNYFLVTCHRQFLDTLQLQLTRVCSFC